MTSVPLHPLQRRWQAEDLVRRRRSDERRRYAAPQRAGRVDANPHQVEAVIFALSRLVDGGCILADEVGLGKTIEAGLVIAQIRAEGARRILLITPKSLLGQWRQELFALFGIQAIDGASPGVLSGEGVFILGREAAGSARGQSEILAAPRFDLIVIDEAHEMFGGLYRRFDAEGMERDDAEVARTAGRVHQIIRTTGAPVLLLTATPIQNSLAELWSLVRFVDPTGTLLGDLGTFRETFCNGSDQLLLEGQEEHLRRRIDVVLRRTLRREAQEFLKQRFVARRSRLHEYAMSPKERALYDDVTAYLREANLAAFRGKQRQLLLIGFHRRMASSTAALAASLENVALRLEKLAKGALDSGDALAEELLQDLEEDDPNDLVPDSTEPPDEAPIPKDAIAAELARVRGFVERAMSIRLASKSKALLDATRLILDRGARGEGSGKVVIFTESIVTQNHLAKLLVEHGLATAFEITLFRGPNDSPRAKEVLDRWLVEEGEKLAPHARPSRDVAMRVALVHEFKTRSKILISTEAGAKGLNLQFCETVINYDLPWNPQRIEQRIGRCHRYGQTRDVAVINFLAKDNETERLLYEILERKLDLFGTVLSASDEILHQPLEPSGEVLASAIGSEIESSLRRIWQTSRTAREEVEEVKLLRDQIEEKKKRFREGQTRTSRLIETYLDKEVRRVFADRRFEIERGLDELDQHLLQIVTAYLAAIGVSYRITPERVLEIDADARLPAELAAGLRVASGPAREAELESLHLGHPLVQASIHAARESSLAGPISVVLPGDAPPVLLERRGATARFVGVLARHHGLEDVERLVPVVIFDGEPEPIPEAIAGLLLGYPMRDLGEAIRADVPDEAIVDAIDEALLLERERLAKAEAARFDRNLEQLERYVDDRLFHLRRKLAESERKIENAQDRHEGAASIDRKEAIESELRRLSAEMERLDAEIARLERREDDTYARCRTRLHERRYGSAEVERLFDVEILVE